MSAAFTFGPQDLNTRLCDAQNCPEEALNGWGNFGWGLCSRHYAQQRAGKPVPIHQIQQPKPIDPATELACNHCGEWLPDEAFSHNGQNTFRRGRRSLCRECCTTKRRAYRLNLPPDKAAEQKIRDAARRRRNRAAQQEREAQA